MIRFFETCYHNDRMDQVVAEDEEGPSTASNENEQIYFNVYDLRPLILFQHLTFPSIRFPHRNFHEYWFSPVSAHLLKR